MAGARCHCENTSQLFGAGTLLHLGEERIMAKLDVRKSGSFKINNDIEIHRFGFGAMRITGPRVWGPPLDMAEAIRTLKRLPHWVSISSTPRTRTGHAFPNS